MVGRQPECNFPQMNHGRQNGLQTKAKRTNGWKHKAQLSTDSDLDVKKHECKQQRKQNTPNPCIAPNSNKIMLHSLKTKGWYKTLLSVWKRFAKNPVRPIMFTNKEEAIPIYSKMEISRNKTIRKREKPITLAGEETWLAHEEKRKWRTCTRNKEKNNRNLPLKRKRERRNWLWYFSLTLAMYQGHRCHNSLETVLPLPKPSDGPCVTRSYGYTSHG